jgi:uncharacterized protein YjbJ (UPF0337 family)
MASGLHVRTDLRRFGSTEHLVADPCARHAWQARSQGRDFIMDKDRIVGSAKVVKGKLKVAVGKSVGDSKLEAEGETEKVEGKIQNAVGGIKDAIRDA